MKTDLHNRQGQASILLLEDRLLQQDGLLEMLESEGYLCRSVADVDEASRYIGMEKIDLLIIAEQQDSLCDAVAGLRELSDAYLPVLAISEHLTDTVLDHYADAEIDAVILRPINFRLLLIKVRSSLRLRQLYQREIEQRKQLDDYWQMLSVEQEVAAKVFNNILKSHFLETDAVTAVISPMSLFNGDLVLVAKTPENHLHLLLGDFTGHGLSASIAATPTAEIFSGMTQKGFSIAEIAAEINGKLHKMLPVNIFLAATLVALKPDSRTLSMITCGLPDHFLIDHASGSRITVSSLNIPLGIQPDIQFLKQSFDIGGSHCLYLLTDGIFEAENAAGEPFGMERIVEAVCETPEADISNLQARLAEHCGDSSQKDDITLVKLICDVENVPWRESDEQQPKRHMEALIWKSAMEFDITTLRALNPVPLMVNTLMEIQGLQDHRQAIFMIVSELFANALDHGLLKLDSSIKNSPDGFMAFYALKEERLQSFSQGKIRFLFAHQPSSEGGRLTIRVKDSGDGFHWDQWRQSLAGNDSYSGRGVMLVDALCSSLTYQGKGNQVVATFDWQK